MRYNHSVPYFKRHALRAACLLFTAALLLTACGTSRHATQPTPSATAAFSAPSFIKKVEANRVAAKTLTAKMSFSIDADGRQQSVGGSLKMKRDDVIQLSLVALGIIEAGRLEFTPQGVLLVDRINHQYTEATYTDLKFLKDANIDFHCLQALFWDELFIPGQQGPIEAGRFKATPSGQSVELQPEGTQKLAYRFITDLATGLIRQTNISSLQVTDKRELNWKCNSFSDFKGRNFPNDITLSLDGTGRTFKVNMKLSRFSDDDSWQTRTEVSSKYKKVPVESILKKIGSL
jgi:hypothetical protein